VARPGNVWLFNLGAEIYGWFTAQDAWRASCARLADHLPPGARPLVLDLGCGPGVSAMEIARRRPDARVHGLDVAPRMLDEARRRIAASTTRQIGLLRGDVTRLPVRTGSLDAVTGHSFLYLLPNRAAALAEMQRVLRPGGRVVLMEPSARPATVATALAVSRDPRHLFSIMLWRPFSRLHGRFSPESLRAAFASAGLRPLGDEESIGGLGIIGWAEKPI
jgi:SAM-dependent methyltransferase